VTNSCYLAINDVGHDERTVSRLAAPCVGQGAAGYRVIQTRFHKPAEQRVALFHRAGEDNDADGMRSCQLDAVIDGRFHSFDDCEKYGSERLVSLPCGLLPRIRKINGCALGFAFDNSPGEYRSQGTGLTTDTYLVVRVASGYIPDMALRA
jgi:hypothetical protein